MRIALVVLVLALGVLAAASRSDATVEDAPMSALEIVASAEEVKPQQSLEDLQSRFNAEMQEMRQKADKREARRKSHESQEKGSRRDARHKRAVLRADSRKERRMKRDKRGKSRHSRRHSRAGSRKEHHRKQLEIQRQNNQQLLTILNMGRAERADQLRALVVLATRCRSCSGAKCNSCPSQAELSQLLDKIGKTENLVVKLPGLPSSDNYKSSKGDDDDKGSKKDDDKDDDKKGSGSAGSGGGKGKGKRERARKERARKAEHRERGKKHHGNEHQRKRDNRKKRREREVKRRRREERHAKKGMTEAQRKASAKAFRNKLREERAKFIARQKEHSTKERQRKRDKKDKVRERKRKAQSSDENSKKRDHVEAERRYKNKVLLERKKKQVDGKTTEHIFKERAKKRRERRSKLIVNVNMERRHKYRVREAGFKRNEANRKQVREIHAKDIGKEHKAKAQKLGEKAIKAEDKEKKDEGDSKVRTEQNYKEKQAKRVTEYRKKKKAKESEHKAESKLKSDQAQREREAKLHDGSEHLSKDEGRKKQEEQTKEYEHKEVLRRRHARELQRKKDGKDAVFAERRGKRHHERIDKKTREAELKLASSQEQQAKLQQKWAESDRKKNDEHNEKVSAREHKRKDDRKKREAHRKARREQLNKKQEEQRQKQAAESHGKDREERGVKAAHNAEEKNKVKAKFEEMLAKQAAASEKALKDVQNQQEASNKQEEKRREHRRESRRKAEDARRQERDNKWNERESKFNEKSNKLAERQAKAEQEAANKVEAKHKQDYAEKRAKEQEQQRERKAKEETAKQNALDGAPIELLNGWRWYGAPYGKPVYHIEGDLCVLSGLITNDQLNNVIAVLPEECRPRDGTHIFSSRIIDSHIRLDVAINGQISIVFTNSGPGWIPLNGITFAINDQSVVPSQLQNGWTPYANGYAPPTMRESNGLCIFSGLGKAGSWGNLMQITDGCKPWDGQLIFSGNNHNANTRWDVSAAGWVVRNGGQTGYGWSSFDGMLWFGKNLHGNVVDVNAGFEQYSYGYRFTKWARVGRLCVLTGLVRKASGNIHVLTLPKECRPRRRIIASGTNADTWKVRIDIDIDGSVTLPGAWFGADWFSLSGIHFIVQGNPENDEYIKARDAKKRIIAESKARLQKYLNKHPAVAKQYELAVGKPITLHSGWKHFAHEDHLIPSWRVLEGICILSGIATIHGGAPVLVGELPPACRPAGGRLIFQTLKGGKAARVDILDNGQIHLVISDSFDNWLTFDGIHFFVANEPLEGFQIHGPFAPYANGYRGPQANLVPIGEKNSVCLVSGLVSGSASHIGTLPPECRPKKGRLIWSVSNHEQITRMDVDNGNGNVLVSGGYQRYNWRALDGIMFSVSDGELLDLRNGWNNYQSGYMPATVTKVGDLCVLSGLIRNGDFHAGMIAVLPAFCRPTKRLLFTANIHDFSARVDVLTNGEVHWVSGRQYDWISLSNIAFVAAPHITGVGTNPWEDTIKCSQFWKNSGEGCPKTWRQNAGAAKQDCNPFLLNCREKCCVPKLITCNQFYESDDGKCPAGYRNQGSAGGQQCYDTPSGGDACRNRCCQYIQPGWGGKCTYWGDPHVISFDANYYDCYNNNEYQMMQNPQLDEEIHVLQRKSPKREYYGVPAFVQGLGFRSHQDVVSVQMVDAHEIFKPEIRVNGRLVPWPERRVTYGDIVLEPTGGRLPDPYAHWNDAGWANTYLGFVNRRTGTSAHVRFYHGGWFRYGEAHIVLARPYMPTHGICGNWDGNRGNDLVYRGTNSACWGGNSDSCCRTWIVPLQSSYFHRTPQGAVDDKQATIEQICGSPQALTDATKLCNTRPKEYRNPCIIEVCGGNNPAVVNQNLNMVQTGRG